MFVQRNVRTEDDNKTITGGHCGDSDGKIYYSRKSCTNNRNKINGT